jgi:hypothetical protein
MKRYLIFFLLVLWSAISQAQWQPEIRLTYDTGSCLLPLNNARGIAISGSIVHVAWCDERNGNREIYYKRSTNSGINWEPDVRFTNNPASSYRPSIAVTGSVVHVVWCDNRDSAFEIYYIRSSNSGVTWGPETRLTYDPAISWAPSLAINGSVLHIVWEETRNGSEEIFYKRSTDAGLNWEPDVRLTNIPLKSFYPSIAVSGNFVHVTWYDYRTGNKAIFYKRSTDAGLTWSQDAQLTGLLHDAYNSSVAVSGQIVHIVWHERRDYFEDIFYRRSTDAGISWQPEIRLTNNNATSWYPAIAALGNSVHVVWYDSSAGNWEIYYARSTNSGLSWDPNTRLTNNFGDSFRPSIAVSDTMVHVVWNDGRDGNLEMYYKRNPNGNPIKVKNINKDIPKDFSLRQNFPNPFNQSTVINYRCSRAGNVKIKIFDITGKEVAILVNEKHQPGEYEIKWNADNNESGIFYYSLFIDNRISETRKMILIK